MLEINLTSHSKGRRKNEKVSLTLAKLGTLLTLTFLSFWQFQNLANKKARTLYLYWGKALWLWSKLKFSLRISVEFSKLENPRTNLSPQKTSLAPRTCENKDLQEIWQIKKAEPPSISSRTLPLKFFFKQALSEDDLSSWQDKSSSRKAESQ